MCRPHRRQASSHRYRPRTQTRCTPKIPCRSWLASDGGVSVARDVGCTGLIAGKPAPTGIGRAHKRDVCQKSPVGAGLPAMAVYQSPVMLDVPASSPASQLPRYRPRTQTRCTPKIPCRSGLASDGGVSVTRDVGCTGLIAGKPAPTGIGSAHKRDVRQKSPVGAGLPAMALYQSPVMLDVPASSPASQLPQVSAAHTNAMYAKNPLWELACQRWRSTGHRESD